MDYSVELLTTPAECDQLLAIADDEIGDLRYRQTTLERQRNTTADSAADVAADLAAATAEVTALTSVIAGLPEGRTKQENQIRLRRATYRRDELTDRRANRGPVAMLDREHDLARVAVQITEIEAFAAAVQARKAAL